LACFSKDVFNSTAEDKFKGSEACVRQLFASAFGRPFVKVRPKFLECLELDGYYEELKMAFEYDGEQHFKFPNRFHNSQDAFEKLQADDVKKRFCVNSMESSSTVFHTGSSSRLFPSS